MDFLFGKKGVWNKGFKFKLKVWSIPFGVPFDAGIEFEKWDVSQSEVNSDNYKLPDNQDLGNI